MPCRGRSKILWEMIVCEKGGGAADRMEAKLGVLYVVNNRNIKENKLDL